MKYRVKGGTGYYLTGTSSIDHFGSTAREFEKAEAETIVAALKIFYGKSSGYHIEPTEPLYNVGYHTGTTSYAYIGQGGTSGHLRERAGAFSKAEAEIMINRWGGNIFLVKVGEEPPPQKVRLELDLMPEQVAAVKKLLGM